MFVQNDFERVSPLDDDSSDDEMTRAILKKASLTLNSKHKGAQEMSEDEEEDDDEDKNFPGALKDKLSNKLKLPCTP